MTLSDLSNLATTVGSIVSSLTLLFIVMQLRASRRFTQAALVNTLEAEFRSLYPVYNRLLDDGEWSNDRVGPTTGEQLCEIEAYVQFFERLGLLLELGVLDLPNLDLMYGQRFFLVMHNTHVQDKLLYRDEDYFSLLIRLYQRWYLYRRSRRLPFPNPNTIPGRRFALSE